MKIRILTGLLFLFGFLVGCAAQPEEADLVRVKQYFVQLRFQAGLRPELQSKTDRELFLISCEQNRVQCSPLLEMLKKKDRPFYEKLQGTSE
jgi:hypothetical protein